MFSEIFNTATDFSKAKYSNNCPSPRTFIVMARIDRDAVQV